MVMDRREMIYQTAHELLCATGAVAAHASDEEIAQRASALEDRYGLLAAIYIGVLAERLVDYQRAARNGDGERARRAWRELVHVAAAAQDVFLWPLEVAQIAERLSELARAEQHEGGDHAAA
jgi:hypothetical protein